MVRYNYEYDGIKYIVEDSDKHKKCFSDVYNYVFNKENGFFCRWGKTKKENPDCCLIGPEILDIEISVNGCPKINGENCRFCYKENSSDKPTNMSFDVFKNIVDKMPKVLTQIAFGITGVQTNPDFIKMLEYSREQGIIPNYTLSGADLTEEIAKKTSELCGAVAVSVYEANKDLCYDTIERFTSLGMNQVNIHVLLSKETLSFVYEVLKDIKKDNRLRKLNAVVFLGIKPKGRAKSFYNSLLVDKYKELIGFCFENNISFGFDSCSAPKFEQSIGLMDLTKNKKESLKAMSESCESSLFSSYINVKGEYWHCSFAENNNDINYVDVLRKEDFINDVWNNDIVENFRSKLINSTKNECRKCIIYDSIN